MNTKKVELTTRQILLYLVDGIVAMHEPFDRHGMYRKNIDDYYDWRQFDKKRFRDNLNRLKKEGIVKIFLKENKSRIELTNKGKEKVKMILAQDFEYKYPKKWDKKWRLIIFDIPDKKRRARDILRFRLKTLGCFALQESVFVFPFDCKDVIDFLKNLYNIEPYVQYVIAEAIETEIDLIKEFLDQRILNEKMIKFKK